MPTTWQTKQPKVMYYLSYHHIGAYEFISRNHSLNHGIAMLAC